MNYRSKEHIYRPSQLTHLDEQQMRRTCSRWIWDAVSSNCLEMLTARINTIVDPYDREYYVTLTHEILLEYMCPDCATPIRIDTCAWEELQNNFRRINRHALREQCEEQSVIADDTDSTTAMVTVGDALTERMNALEMRVEEINATNRVLMQFIDRIANVQLPKPNDYKSVVEWLALQRVAGRDLLAESGYNKAELCRTLTGIFGWVVDRNSLGKRLNYQT